MNWLSTRKAKPRARAAPNACTVIISLRRSSRSPNTPVRGFTRRLGSVLIAPTDTTSSPPIAEPSDRSLTSHPTLNSCSQVALLAQKFAHHSSRKSRKWSRASSV